MLCFSQPIANCQSLKARTEMAFVRKFEYEAAFKGVVKISRLKTAGYNLNPQLNRKNDRGFLHFAQKGDFLLMFGYTIFLQRQTYLS